MTQLVKTNEVLDIATDEVLVLGRRKQERIRKPFGMLTEGIKPGDYVDGIIIDFEIHELYGTKSIILKKFDGEEIKVYGNTSLEYELHKEKQKPYETLIYNIGDAIRVTFEKVVRVQKGPGMGKDAAIYNIVTIIPPKWYLEGKELPKTYIQSQTYLSAPKPVTAHIPQHEMYVHVQPQSFIPQPKVGYQKVESKRTQDDFEI